MASVALEILGRTWEPENQLLCQQTFKKLIYSAYELGIKDIVLPCVDNSSIQNKIKRSVFKENIIDILKEAEKYNINIALETDLNPKEFAILIEQIASENIKVNYDTGNSTSLGYNFIDELSAVNHYFHCYYISN